MIRSTTRLLNTAARFLLTVLVLPAGLAATELDVPPPMPPLASSTADVLGSSEARLQSGVPAGSARQWHAVDQTEAAAPKLSVDVRIEQRRQGNRIVELRVTPAASARSYLIVNREGQRPLSVQEMSAGLSTPRFFKLDF